MWWPTEAELLFVVLSCVIVVLAGVSVMPALAMSLYLAPNRKIARENMKIGVVASFFGAVIFASALYDPVARTPPPAFYLIAGAWLGGPIGVALLAAMRMYSDPKQYGVQRSVSSLIVLITFACIAFAIAGFIWQLEW